jgi:protein SCO1/2
MRAITHIRYRNEPVSFENYGEYGGGDNDTTPVQELLTTLRWLGRNAQPVLSELEQLRARPEKFPRTLLAGIDEAINAIAGKESIDNNSCCSLPLGLKDKFSWTSNSRRGCEPVESVIFEDHNNELITFGNFFQGQPSIVVFFYTRCDNPMKCSLSITKLARIQDSLVERGLADKINTAAITYDPEFDLPERIRGYGQNRGVQLNARHRMLRARDDVDSLRKHFRLGVNFIESLVNRHRVEVYILDRQGKIASVFERIHWNEEQVVQRAIEILHEESENKSQTRSKRNATASTLGTMASLGVAFFPKCPICWAAYLSVFGIAGLDRIPYAPWLQPVLALIMLINLATVWLRSRATHRMLSFYFAVCGAAVILVSKLNHGWEKFAISGVLLTLAGSLLSALGTTRYRRLGKEPERASWFFDMLRRDGFARTKDQTTKSAA